MMRKVVVGTGLMAFVPKVIAASPIEDKELNKPPLMRFSDLPIYDAPHATYAELMHQKTKKDRENYIRKALREPVSAVRQQAQNIWEQTNTIKHSVKDNYQEFRDRTDWIVKIMREEENKGMRYGAVVMGGMTGFIFGLRGGFIRRLIYTGAGTTAMGALCFPEETSEIMSSNGALMKQYINIAYNFLYGVDFFINEESVDEKSLPRSQ